MLEVFELSEGHFSQIAAIAKKQWGLDLTEKKKQLVRNRLAKFLRKSPWTSVDEYLEHLAHHPDGEDQLMFFDLLSTNVTSFFREQSAFDYLEREFYTPLTRGNLTLPRRRIRIWSAACSTGPEPYSIGIHALEHLAPFDQWDFRILATDLATSALTTAKNATYPNDMVSRIPAELVRKYFDRNVDGTAKHVRVREEVRRLVTFGRVNLMDPWPFRGPFDIIFCRNVMIYFDRETRTKLVNRIYDLLRPGGIFVIGSAETLSGEQTRFKTAQPSVYIR